MTSDSHHTRKTSFGHDPCKKNRGKYFNYDRTSPFPASPPLHLENYSERSSLAVSRHLVGMRSSAALLDRSGCVSGEERPTNARLARQLSRYPIDERNLVSEATEIVRDTRADKSQILTRVIAYTLKSPLKSNSWRKSCAKRPNLSPKPNISPPDPLACRYLTFPKPLAQKPSLCEARSSLCANPRLIQTSIDRMSVLDHSQARAITVITTSTDPIHTPSPR